MRRCEAGWRRGQTAPLRDYAAASVREPSSRPLKENESNVKRETKNALLLLVLRLAFYVLFAALSATTFSLTVAVTFALKLDRNFELAELLDRLRQEACDAIDPRIPLCGERCGDVGRRDGAEQHLVLADLPGDLDFHGAHASGQALGDLLLFGFLRLELLALALDLLLVAVGGEQGQLAGQEVVACVPVGDLDDLAAVAEVVGRASSGRMTSIVVPLIRHVWNQRDLAGALDRNLKLALVHRARA